MILYRCDFCDQIRECVQKKIDGKFYDVCLECWSPIEAKLKGKGRTMRTEELEVYLPPPNTDDRPDKGETFPGAPPDPWLSEGTVH
jgi:hypothetical protein